MADKKLKTVKDQYGNPVTGVEVGVAESVERFSEITLEDGTVIRTKLSVVSAIRQDEVRDDEGNPVYTIKSQHVVMVVNSPLRKENDA